MHVALAARLEAHVRHLAETIGVRHFQRPEALTATERYLARQLAEVGAVVTEHEFHVDGQRFVNLEVLCRPIPRQSVHFQVHPHQTMV
jgi:hypothetical protein